MIEVHKRIAGSPAELLCIRGMYEAMLDGHILGLHVTPTNEVITASDNGQAVAFVTFEEYEENGEFWIVFGYCLPDYRRKGYYRDCIEKLREVAKERGYHRIHTAVHCTNEPARASIEARGGKLQYLGYVFPTTP
jgi:RimJ/RimL family protein N-acetyltransferase